MRQVTLDAYAVWINWFFDNPWMIALGICCLIGSFVLHYRAVRGRWGR